MPKHCPGLFLDFASSFRMLSLYFGWLFEKTWHHPPFCCCFVVHRWDSCVKNIIIMFLLGVRPVEEALLVETWGYLCFLALFSCKAQDFGQKMNPARFQLQLRDASRISGVQHQLYWMDCWKIGDFFRMVWTAQKLLKHSDFNVAQSHAWLVRSFRFSSH